ncbi:MAG: glycerol-3-phosphate acyltransferase [Actinomycetota bacterium]|nr:glycerol-3-phosphate acyltransferase [Actinomycetota bacterium]
MHIIVAAAVVASCYLLGTFPTALVVGRARGLDPTSAGSGNPGASNVYRLAGRRAGLVVALVDVAKGAAAAGLGLALDGRVLGLSCGLAAVVGHILPVTRPGRGGKGVATSAGMALVLWPLVGLAAAVTFGVVARLTRVAAIGSLVACVVVVAGVGVVTTSMTEVAFAAALAILVITRHRANVSRLLRRVEHRLPG